MYQASKVIIEMSLANEAVTWDGLLCGAGIWGDGWQERSRFKLGTLKQHPWFHFCLVRWEALLNSCLSCSPSRQLGPFGQDKKEGKWKDGEINRGRTTLQTSKPLWERHTELCFWAKSKALVLEHGSPKHYPVFRSLELYSLILTPLHHCQLQEHALHVMVKVTR